MQKSPETLVDKEFSMRHEILILDSGSEFL